MTDDMLINLNDYEITAAGRLNLNAFGYYAGGADDEITLRRNRAAFDEIALLPRVLVDISQRDTSINMFGIQYAAPIVIAPMAIMKLAHRDGELAMAHAAATAGLPFTVSTFSSTRLETIATETNASLWFQLYIYKDREITRDLINRVEAAGYQALVVTVDASIAGNRERDVRNRFKLPKGIQLENVVDFALQHMKDQADDSAIAAYAVSQLDQSLTWQDLAWLANLTSLPILVKGILRPDDANRALAHGAAGIVVSNHGGRQLDTTPAAIDVLPSIIDEVGYAGDVLMDGGVRRGTDILKALAYGAKAVMVGRPMLWGLAVDGEAGAAAVMNILKTEFDRAMALTGCTHLGEINRDLIFSRK